MPTPIINSVASWFLKKRIHQMELFYKYPSDVQYELLMNLLNTAKHTHIGSLYEFNTISNYYQFASRVPLSTYEDQENLITRCRKGENNLFWPTPIKWFAKSSGTTNAKSKFIPVSQASLLDCHYKASKDLLCLYFNNNPDSKLLAGKSLRLGGSKQLHKHNNTYFGDLSAILIDNMPFWADKSSTPSSKVSLMSNWEEKTDAIIQETLSQNVTSLAGVPSWMLVLLNKIIDQNHITNLSEIWPNLEVYFHGGVSFSPYREQYKQILPSTAQFYEVYNASEGFFALQDQNNSDELLLMLDYGIFYEFIEMTSFHTDNPKVVPLSEVEKDINYAIVITTNAGLWRYIIGDTCRFTSTSPYRIKITGRTKHFINVFGEELIIENAEDALKKVCAEMNCEVKDYTVAPIFMSSDTKKGAHEWVIEFGRRPENMEAFRILLDHEIQQLNSDYEAKRHHNTTLTLLEINVAPEGLFYNWLKSKGKLGGQHKIPRLSNTRVYLEELKRLEVGAESFVV